MTAPDFVWKRAAWPLAAALAICGCSSHSSSKAAAVAPTSRPVTTLSSPSSSHTSSPTSTTAAGEATSSTHSTPPTAPPEPPPTTPPTAPPPGATTDSSAATAARFVRSRGFTPEDTQDFAIPPTDGLHVIVATASGSADGYAQRAFFFVGGRFLRTDLPESSAGIHIAWRNGTTIGLSYAVYKTADAMCCPTGGAMIVRYEWNGTRLKALDPIPPPAARR